MPRVAASTAPVLTRRVEWTFLRFVRGLYFPEAGDPGGAAWRALDPARGLSGPGAGRPLFRALEPILARGTWRFLVRHGGYRSREVIVAGRKRAGRIWDETTWGADPLAIGHGTFAWLAVLWDSLAALHARSPEPASRTIDLALGARLGPGDRLALAAALAPLGRDREVWRQISETPRGLGTRIPLFGLAQPWLLPSGETPGWTFDTHAEDLALQYLDDWLVGTWIEAIAARGRHDHAHARTWDDGMARAIDALFRVAAPGDRPGSGKEHLLVVLAKFFPALLRRMGGAHGLRRFVEGLSRTITSTGEREAFETGFGTVLRGGVRLDAVVSQIVATPWPDRTESQKRLAAEHETTYRPVRDEIRQISRTLRREVG